MPTTLIEFLRHGLPEGGARYRGDGVDDALCAEGWQQMWQAVGTQRRWDRIVTSPLHRCRDFAEQLGRRDGIPVVVDGRFREVGFGAWEGLSHAEVRGALAEEYARFVADPVTHRPAGAEPLEAFRERVAQGLAALCRDHAGDKVLVVCHAGVMRAVINHTLRAPLRSMYLVKIDNAAIVRLSHGQRGFLFEGLIPPGSAALGA